MLNQVSATFALDAEKQLSNGLFEEAISTCLAGLAEYPGYPSAICILAKAYYLAGELNKSKSVIQSGIEHFPANVAINQLYTAIEHNELIGKSPNINLKTPINNEIKIEENATKIVKTEASEESLCVAENNGNGEDLPESDAIFEHLNKIEQLTDLLKNVDKINLNNDYVENNSYINVGNSVDENVNEEMEVENGVRIEYIAEELTDETDENVGMIDEDAYFPSDSLANSIAQALDATVSTIDKSAEYIENSDIQEVPLDNEQTIQIEDIEEINIEIDPLQPTNKEDLTDESETINNDLVELETEVPDSIVEHSEELIFELHTTSISGLYKIDLDLPRIEIASTFDAYELKHSLFEIDFANINYLLKPVNWDIHIKNSVELNNKKDFSSLFIDKIAGTISSETADNTAITAEINIDSDLSNENNELDNTSIELLDIAKGLENAKITPVVEDYVEKEECEIPLVASETMAKIFIKQNKLEQATKIFQLLISEKPDKAGYFNEQIEILKQQTKTTI